MLLYLYTKIQKYSISQFFIEFEKSYYRPNLSISTQKPQNRFFSKKISSVNFKTLCCCNFMQKIRKILPINFSWSLGSFWALSWHSKFMSKIKKFPWTVPEKKSHKPTNRQMSKGYLKRPSLCGSNM